MMWKKSNQVTLKLDQCTVLWLCRHKASPARALGSRTSSGRREPEVWCKLQEGQLRCTELRSLVQMWNSRCPDV